MRAEKSKKTRLATVMQVLVGATVDGTLLVDHPGNQVRVKSNSTAVLKNSYILKHILMDWKIWQQGPRSGEAYTCLYVC